MNSLRIWPVLATLLLITAAGAAHGQLSTPLDSATLDAFRWRSIGPAGMGERVISMGDIAIEPSDTMIVWAGTGEEDSRNSISPGGGIYKSTDGGLTWTHMGLTATQVIGRIVIHPTNPDIVYVVALGHIWGRNPDAGSTRPPMAVLRGS